jgi:hypothetical protein
MRVACLIQGDSWVALNKLLATHNGASMITADLADQNVSLEIGDASLVLDGEQFAAHVVAQTNRELSSRPSTPMRLQKNFLQPLSWARRSCKNIFSPGESSNDSLDTNLDDEQEAYEHQNALNFIWGSFEPKQ